MVKSMPLLQLQKKKLTTNSNIWERTKLSKNIKNIKDFYSWADEVDSEKVNTEPTKSHSSPKIYDLCTPVKKYKGTDNTEIVLLTDSSPDFSKKTEGKINSDKPTVTSSSHATSLVEVTFDEVKTRAKCSMSGELHCYKNDSIIWTSVTVI